MSIGKRIFPLFLLCTALAAALTASQRSADALSEPRVLRHALNVELRPASHELIATDTMELDSLGDEPRLTFSLAASLSVESVTVSLPAGPTALPFTSEPFDDGSGQRIIVDRPPGLLLPRLTWTYRGTIHDPPKEARHLRFVTPSETAGHIGSEGVYLSSESRWYPDMEGALGRFEVTATVPRGWTVVTQGRKEQESLAGELSRSSWTVADPSEALTLVANNFVVKTRSWNGPNGQQVELAAYLFPDEAGLADEYLDASGKYLDVYVPLLGRYPFEKFAVVENFFASGLGMPSFTLLGSGSIKRHYVQPYALGHEIVHSWIGNSVFNRQDGGNWVEGLTTYLANYYWHERMGDEAQAREQRRLMIQAYGLYVPPAKDYPVARFIHKTDEKDNAIGYQKAAFVFHLLRTEIEDAAFWAGVQRLASQFRNKTAGWRDLEQVFTAASGRDLRWFFHQWVEETGAPSLSLGEATAVGLHKEGSPRGWHLTLSVRQSGRPFRLTVPIVLRTDSGTQTRWFSLDQVDNRLEWDIADRPRFVQLDPDVMVFRRLARSDISPMLNGFVTDGERTVVKAFSEKSPLTQVAARLGDAQGQPGGTGTHLISAGDQLPATGSILLLAEADHRTLAQSLLHEACGNRVTLAEQGVQISGHQFDGPTIAVLVSCHRSDAPGSVLSVLYGVTPQSVAKVARLLFYYGWHSAVVFQDGAVVRRDLWDGHQSAKEVQLVDG